MAHVGNYRGIDRMVVQLAVAMLGAATLGGPWRVMMRKPAKFGAEVAAFGSPDHRA
jgi:hypothetical protein